MCNLRYAHSSTRLKKAPAGARHPQTTRAHRLLHLPSWRSVAQRLLLALAALMLFPAACAIHERPTLGGSPGHFSAAMNTQPCLHGRCDGDDMGGSAGEPHGVDSGKPAPTAPPCEQWCVRITQTYHDPRTQDLLIMLAQTPTGQRALDYLLTMSDRLGERFITWQDMGKDGNAGENNAGGYIKLNSAMLTRRDLGPFFLAGILVHEAVESYFDIAEGIRGMGTRHADYVAQWFNGKFERELHVLAYYDAQDPFYLPNENSAYGLRYEAWLNGTEDGRLYLSNPESCDLQSVDRKGRAWPPSDWWAEQGGFWMLGQGTDVTPVSNPLALTTAMLVTSDLRSLAQ
jgi:hypothetical protein